MTLYPHDVGGTALLTREGEAALATRIEAGRRIMLDGLVVSLPAMAAVSAWRDAIHEGSLALRDAIDVGPPTAPGTGTVTAAGRRCRRRRARGHGRHRWRQTPVFRDGGGGASRRHGEPRRDRGIVPEAAPLRGEAHRAGPGEPDADDLAGETAPLAGARSRSLAGKPSPDRYPHRGTGGRTVRCC